MQSPMLCLLLRICHFDRDKQWPKVLFVKKMPCGDEWNRRLFTVKLTNAVLQYDCSFVEHF